MEGDYGLPHLFAHSYFTLLSSLPTILPSPLGKQLALLRKMISELARITTKPSCNLIGSQWLLLPVKDCLNEFQTTFSVNSTARKPVRSALSRLCLVPNDLKKGISRS